MSATAAEMNTLASAVRSNTSKEEAADLQDRIAQWRKKEKEKAKRCIAQLPEAIKCVAEKGKYRLIVRVEITHPYLGLDIKYTYRVLKRWNSPTLLESETPN